MRPLCDFLICYILKKYCSIWVIYRILVGGTDTSHGYYQSAKRITVYATGGDFYSSNRNPFWHSVFAVNALVLIITAIYAVAVQIEM